MGRLDELAQKQRGMDITETAVELAAGYEGLEMPLA